MVVDIMAVAAVYQGSPFFCVPIHPRGRGREERGEGWATKSQGGVTALCPHPLYPSFSGRVTERACAQPPGLEERARLARSPLVLRPWVHPSAGP